MKTNSMHMTNDYLTHLSFLHNAGICGIPRLQVADRQITRKSGYAANCQFHVIASLEHWNRHSSVSGGLLQIFVLICENNADELETVGFHQVLLVKWAYYEEVNENGGREASLEQMIEFGWRRIKGESH